jgi:hypothetical protein
VYRYVFISEMKIKVRFNVMNCGFGGSRIPSAVILHVGSAAAVDESFL